MSYIKAIDKLEQYYRGEMLHFNKRGMDLLVTPNHKMFSWRVKSNGKYIPNEMLNAKEIKRSHLHPLTGYSYIHNIKNDVKNEDFFTLPSVNQIEQYTGKEITVEEKKISMGDWLEFFGFYLADGCYRDHINTLGKRDYTVSIAQNEENLNYVLSLIDAIGFKPRYGKKQKDRKCYNISIYSKQLWMYLEQFGRSPDKYIPREFLNLEPKYLERLLLGFIMGDSQINEKTLTITSRSIHLVQGLQEVILKLYGEIAHVSKRVDKYKGEDYVYYKLTLHKNI